MIDFFIWRKLAWVEMKLFLHEPISLHDAWLGFGWHLGGSLVMAAIAVLATAACFRWFRWQ